MKFLNGFLPFSSLNGMADQSLNSDATESDALSPFPHAKTGFDDMVVRPLRARAPGHCLAPLPMPSSVPFSLFPEGEPCCTTPPSLNAGYMMDILGLPGRPLSRPVQR
ncbi:unnamed protein product [Ostreobium quekettii]|uniref:Uncharacterized protein n=1 Tax=Ostreobium quekettii TaxID=121088 RepID=A0A8S1IZ10_9CHLO|nr:unnamed protein product [Ostreobium quekettii]